jgi:hypothetical protein
MDEKLLELSRRQSTLALSDVARYGHHGATKLTPQPRQLVLGKSASSLISVFGEIHSLLPCNEVLIRMPHARLLKVCTGN